VIYSVKHYLGLFCSIAFFSLLLAGCGGGSAGGGTGSVALLLTDATTEEFSQINITVTRVELISETRKVTIFSGTRTFDLLKLEDESKLFSVSPRVPSLWYNKIRLHVSHIELLKKDNITKIYPKLPGGGKLDLNPRGQFHVVPGETLILQVDLDAEKSIHIVETGSGEKYIVRPVVFVDILDHISRGKLVRLHGLVKDIDLRNMTFNLCPARKVKHADSPFHDDYVDADNYVTRCVQIHNSPSTSYFDNNGDQVRFTALAEGFFVTAIGHLRVFPTITESGGDGPHRIGLEAILIEWGRFLRLKGMVESLPDGLTKRFDFELADGQGFPAGTSIEVELQIGTKVYSRNGVELTESDIEVGLKAKIDGVLILSDIDPDYLKAALVLLRRDAHPGAEKLEGLISGLDPPAMSLNLFDPDTSTTTCVELTEHTNIFLITNTATGYTCEEIDIWSLSLRQSVKIFGYYDSAGCFVADTILASPL
jgi:hypothetical protein